MNIPEPTHDPTLAAIFIVDAVLIIATVIFAYWLLGNAI